MKAGSALACAPLASPALAETAVSEAMQRAGCRQASQVILLLSPHFARQPQPAITAAARVAGSLEVVGCVASGLFTEHGWQLDQPAAAALVLAEQAATGSQGGLKLSFAAHGRLPPAWRTDAERAGLIDNHGVSWAHARVQPDGGSASPLTGLQTRIVVARGWRRLGTWHTVDTVQGHELLQLDGITAADSLGRALPGELRDKPPLHALCLLGADDEESIPLLALNANRSLTLARALVPGERVAWGIRQPLAAEQDIRSQLSQTVDREKSPLFAVMCSCIGRGPLFYGDDDRDLQVFRETFPGVPLIGAYGTGQIIPHTGGNQAVHNAAVTLLYYETEHV